VPPSGLSPLAVLFLLITIFIRKKRVYITGVLNA